MYQFTLKSLIKLSACFFLRLACAKGSNELIDVTTHPNWHLVNSDKCGTSLADRIVGGKDASLGQYPWIARLGYNTSIKPIDNDIFRCGGTLINQRYVVTAAHCVSELPSSLKVSLIRLGDHRTDTDPDCSSPKLCAEPVQDFTPTQQLVHKDYSSTTFKNDIAMIRLDRDASFNGWVMPICLPHSTLLTKDYVGEVAEVAGWGIYDVENAKTSVILQTVRLPIVDLDKCAAAFKKYARVGETQMCVGGKLGQDSCGGDSGGPLMKVDVLNGPPKCFLTGIVSFGAKNCGANMPAIYTRVASFIDWILDNMEE